MIRNTSANVAQTKSKRRTITSKKINTIVKIVGKLKYIKRKRKISLYLKKLAKWSGKIKQSDYNAKIIVACSHFGMVNISEIEVFLAKLLSENSKTRIVFAICDGSLEACTMCEEKKILNNEIDIDFIKATECIACTNLASKVFEKYLNKDNIELLKWGKYKDDEEKNVYEETNKLLVESSGNNYKIEHALAGTVRYLGKPITFKNAVANHREVMRKYLEASIRTSICWSKILKDQNPDLLIINHGMYVPQGIINEEARRHGVKTRVWHKGYRKNTLLMTENETYHKVLTKISSQKKHILNTAERGRIEEYLISRRDGKNDQIMFAHKNAEQINVQKYLKHASNKNITLILTNVGWDAQCHYENNVYTSMFEWLDDVIERIIIDNKEEYFLIRCHPAEVTGRRVSTIKTSDYIKQKFGHIDNMTVISSSEKVSTYKLIEHCKKVIVYATKTAVEAACMGKPVLVCGESFIRGKGISVDQIKKSDLVVNYKQLEDFKIDNEAALSAANELFFKQMVDCDWQLNDNTGNNEIHKSLIREIL